MKKVFLVIFVFCARAVFSQTPEQIQRSQQQLIDAGFRKQELERAISKPSTQQPQQHEETAPQTSSHCVQINSIEFDGNTKLSNGKIKKLAKPFLNKCLAVDEINKLLNTITNAYIDKGYITSGAYLKTPQTKTKEGILQIKIIEGSIEKFDGLTEAERISAFPNLLGKILNLRDIEQGLDQMNRLSSNHATMEIKASETENGTSQVVIKNTPDSRVSYNTYSDNLGSQSTGQYRAGVNFGIDNMLGVNDQLNIGYTNSLTEHYGDKNSHSASIGFSVPFGYWTFTNNASYSYYKTNVKLPISREKLYSFGDSWTDNFSVERLLSRGQKYKVSALVGLTYKENDNYTKVLDILTKNEVSSRRLSNIEYALPTTIYFDRGVMFAKPSFVNGVKLFGSLEDDGTFAQKAQFEAYILYIYSGFNFGFVNLATTFDGQYSRDELFSSDGFYIGSEASVRGFSNDGITGDSGFYIRNDLKFSLSDIFKSQNVFLRDFSPSIFFDYGFVKANNNDEKSELSSMGAKINYRYKILNFSTTYAHPLKKENGMNGTPETYFTISINGRF